MKKEFTRKELYDLVWSQPMRTVAAAIGISDVALAKHCKKANIPVPSRGYWAQKQAGKPTIQTTMPPRFFGASDRIGRSRDDYWRGDWVQEFREIAVPPEPTFDEEMSSVENRARTLVGTIRCSRKFEPVHPMVAKLLAHDEVRRQDYMKYKSDYYAPRYDGGIERRRLLIVNTLFLATQRLGCRPSMSTSKYGQDPSSERGLTIAIGECHVDFTLEPVKSKNDEEPRRLRLAFGTAPNKPDATKSWEDDKKRLEDQLADVISGILIEAESAYRVRLARHREWIIERKAAAEAEARRRREEAERKAQELEERKAEERIGRLLSQAKALERADQIRTYVDAVLLRATTIEKSRVEAWAAWARREADRIDPVKNGIVDKAVQEHASG